jgi:hypothetical protein
LRAIAASVAPGCRDALRFAMTASAGNGLSQMPGSRFAFAAFGDKRW